MDLSHERLICLGLYDAEYDIRCPSPVWQMNTPKKRNLSDVEPTSSPELEVKRHNMGDKDSVTQPQPTLADVIARLDQLDSVHSLCKETQESINDCKQKLEAALTQVKALEESNKQTKQEAAVCRHENVLLKK